MRSRACRLAQSQSRPGQLKEKRSLRSSKTRSQPASSQNIRSKASRPRARWHRLAAPHNSNSLTAKAPRTQPDWARQGNTLPSRHLVGSASPILTALKAMDHCKEARLKVPSLGKAQGGSRSKTYFSRRKPYRSRRSKQSKTCRARKTKVAKSSRSSWTRKAWLRRSQGPSSTI